MQESVKHSHFVLYKPHGYLSQFKNNGPKKKSKKLLGELGDFPEGTMAVGRLDEQSEGLLLLTTDGKTSHLICSGNTEKEYYALVDGIMKQEDIQRLSQGVEIGVHGQKYQTKPCRIMPLDGEPDFPLPPKKIRDSRHGPTSWISIVLQEGKYRQVRKMTAAVGFPTLRLVRVRIGHISIQGLKPGGSREVPHLMTNPESP